MDKLSDILAAAALASTSRPEESTQFFKSNFDLYLEVLDERLSQNLKFTGDVLGEQHHSIITWSAINSEEAGEMTQAALDAVFAGEPLSKVREEAKQNAAVCFAIMRAIDAKDTALLSPLVTQDCQVQQVAVESYLGDTEKEKSA
jgi:hypothetical protein